MRVIHQVPFLLPHQEVVPYQYLQQMALAQRVVQVEAERLAVRELLQMAALMMVVVEAAVAIVQMVPMLQLQLAVMVAREPHPLCQVLPLHTVAVEEVEDNQRKDQVAQEEVVQEVAQAQQVRRVPQIRVVEEEVV